MHTLLECYRKKKKKGKKKESVQTFQNSLTFNRLFPTQSTKFQSQFGKRRMQKKKHTKITTTKKRFLFSKILSTFAGNILHTYRHEYMQQLIGHETFCKDLLCCLSHYCRRQNIKFHYSIHRRSLKFLSVCFCFCFCKVEN